MARIICKEIWEMWSTQVTMYLTKNPTTNARQEDWIYWVELATYTFFPLFLAFQLLAAK